MKAKLIKITGIYTLLDGNDRMVASDDVDMQKDYQIGKLSTKNCDEIFGVVDVELMSDFYGANAKGNVDFKLGSAQGFEYGFNKAMELNKDKLFTMDDIKKALTYGWRKAGLGLTVLLIEENEFIQSIKQPTEIEVTFNPEEKDSEGCLILKKI